jgi:hypothetical protein
VGVSVLPHLESFTVERRSGPTSGRLSAISDLLSTDASVRALASVIAGDHLVSTLERESTRVVEWCLHYYDDACAQVQAAFVNAIDAFAQTAGVASARAREAKAGGRHTLAQAHERIDAGLATLNALHRRFQ